MTTAKAFGILVGFWISLTAACVFYVLAYDLTDLQALALGFVTAVGGVTLGQWWMARSERRHG
jgi:hypothetical protein